MTDITKCSGRNCKSASQCYRYTAPDDDKHAQAYADFELQLDADNQRCPDFWDWKTVPHVLGKDR